MQMSLRMPFNAYSLLACVVCTCCLSENSVLAYTNGTTSGGTTSAASKPGIELSPLPSSTSTTPTPTPQPVPALKVRPKAAIPFENQVRENLYSFPGVVTWHEGEWIGKDNLYNISKDISIDIDLIKPPGITLPLSEGAIRAEVMSILQRAGIVPSSIFHVGSTPLPFVNVLLMIQPIDKGYAALCAFRFFEEVHLERINLEKTMTWQVITWEKQEILIAPPESLQAQVLKVLSDMTTAFVDRFKADGSGVGPKGYIKR